MLAMVWTVAMDILRELERMSTTYSSLWCRMSASRRIQSADWIPVSWRPNVSSRLSRSCWAM
eukprot:8344811-Alexandrium_andersonii.AAC.1